MGGYLDISVDGDLVACHDCYSSEGYYDCNHCGYPAHPGTSYDTTEGMVCPTCYEDEYEKCDECNRVVSDTWRIDGDYFCRDCARRRVERAIISVAECDDGDECEECTETLEAIMPYAVNVNAFGIDGTRWACSLCGDRRFGLPAGTNFEQAHLLATGSFADAVCHRCVRNGGATGPYRVLNYSFKPPPRFKRTDRDLDKRSLHFGTEVELDMAKGRNKDEALVQLGAQDKTRLFYCKHDVSAGEGFEVVTHPFTYDWMKHNPEAFKPMFDLATLMRGFESVKCGMHVHMSKDAFSELQMFKFMNHWDAGQRAGSTGGQRSWYLSAAA
jgi:hypothetical protein